MYTTFSRRVSRRPYDHHDLPDASSTMGRQHREEIALSRDHDDPDLYHAAKPFVPGSESVAVNGVHYYSEDYILEMETQGIATGFIIAMSEPTDDVRLVAEPVK